MYDLTENWELGYALPCIYGHPGAEATIDRIIVMANESLPPGTVFEVRGKTIPFDGREPYGLVVKAKVERAQEWGVAWYWRRGIEKLVLMDRIPHAQAENWQTNGQPAGWCLIARLKTPDLKA